MTQPDFRALCAELLQESSSLYSDMSARIDFNDIYIERMDNLLDRARAALAQPEPEPEGPTDEELEALAQELDDVPVQAVFAFARAVLARWGHPTPQPIPVSERLPGPEDCDAEGRCWLWAETLGGWIYRSSGHIHSGITHWLPAHALPLPQEPEPPQ